MLKESVIVGVVLIMVTPFFVRRKFRRPVFALAKDLLVRICGELDFSVDVDSLAVTGNDTCSIGGTRIWIQSPSQQAVQFINLPPVNFDRVFILSPSDDFKAGRNQHGPFGTKVVFSLHSDIPFVGIPVDVGIVF